MRTGILQYAQNFHLELFNAIAGENGAPNAVHSRTDIS